MKNDKKEWNWLHGEWRPRVEGRVRCEPMKGKGKEASITTIGDGSDRVGIAAQGSIEYTS